MTGVRHDDSDDYYRILGVKTNASPEEIAAAFYALARRHHPDVSNDLDPSSRQFKKIVEAYETLADPFLRKAYDKRHTKKITVRDGRSDQPDERWTAAEADGTHKEPSPSVRDPDIHAELFITPEESRFGGPCEIRLRRFTVCPRCRSGAGSSQCDFCQASGYAVQREKLVLNLPPGVASGAILQLTGYGHQQPGGDGRRRAGTLYLRVVVRPCW